MRIVILGAAGGIGGAIAHRRALAGDQLVLVDSNGRALDHMAAVLGRACAAAVCADLASADVDARLAAAVAPCGGAANPIDALVNCAGIGGWTPTAELDATHWDALMHTNVRGPMLATKALLPQLRRPGGTIVHLASDSALHPVPRRPVYCASKAALAMFADVAREELRHQQIRVSTVYCNRVDTAFNGGTPGSRPQALQPSDLADVVDMILSLPARVEIRDISVATVHSSFGA